MLEDGDAAGDDDDDDIRDDADDCTDLEPEIDVGCPLELLCLSCTLRVLTTTTPPALDFL